MDKCTNSVHVQHYFSQILQRHNTKSEHYHFSFYIILSLQGVKRIDSQVLALLLLRLLHRTAVAATIVGDRVGQLVTRIDLVDAR